MWHLDHAASGDRLRLFDIEIGIPSAYAEIRIPSNEVYVEIGGGSGGMALTQFLDPYGVGVGCRMYTGPLPTLEDAHRAVAAFIECCWSLRKDATGAEP